MASLWRSIGRAFGAVRRRKRARRIVTRFLLAFAAFYLLQGTIQLYADRHLFDSRDFSERAAHALEEDDVRGAIGVHITDEVVQLQPDLIGARPLIETAADGITGTGAFQALFRKGVEQVHASVFKRGQDTVALKVADVGLLVVQALEQINPTLAEKVPKGFEGTLLRVSEGNNKTLVRVAQVGEDVHGAAATSAILIAVLLALALLASVDRRQTLRTIGFILIGVGVVIVVAFQVGRAVVPNQVPGQDQAALRAAWDVFLLDLRTWALVVAGAGAVLAATANALRRPEEVDDTVERAWGGLIQVPRTPWRASVRALVLVAIGLLLIVVHETMITLAVVAGGLYLVYVGVLELVRVAVPTARWAAGEIDEEIDETVGDVRRFGRGGGWRRLGRRYGPVVGAGAIAVALITGGVVVASTTNEAEQPPHEIRACNGHAALCDRTLDKVAFASTHNSMSDAAQKNWLFGEQENGLAGQLDAGIRGLLIDTHYGVETKKGVYTVLGAGSKSRLKLSDQLGEEFVSTAERLRARLGYRGGGDKDEYLCHGYCELGAKKAVESLEAVRDFLVQHPYEVLVISIEDGITPEDTEKVFRESGLLDYVYTGPLRPLPTPRKMIEGGGRVVVFGEEKTGDVPWYHPQFDFVQETPFDLTSVAEVEAPSSCKLNRGRAANPIFMLNNWVQTAPASRPSNAAKVNAYDALLERARRCQRIRKRFPAMVAVDFYEQGDLFGVVDTLNGVGRKR